MIAKARVAQLTGLPSITATAEGPVTFGCFFYRWKARLLSGWGSSLAQGTGGLKFGSGDRRAGEDTRPYGVSEGAFDLL